MTNFFSRRLFAVVRRAAIVFALCSVPAAAQVPKNSPGFWGLRPGNEIMVLVDSSRRTEISVDDKPDVVRETSESQRIQYQVVAIERTGDVIVKAVVKELERHPPSPLLNRLTGANFLLTVQPGGQVSTVSPEGRDALVTYLANGDPESAVVLKKCVTDDTIASWFSVPFWLIQPLDPNNRKTWEHSHVMSLGTLGMVHTDLGFQPGDTNDRLTNVEIAGAARYRPLVLPNASGPAVFPFWSDTTLEIDGVTGSGQIAVTPMDGDETFGSRPSFESLEWTVRLHGETQLPRAPVGTGLESSDGESTSRTSGEERPKALRVRFRMKQSQKWTLLSYSVGSPRMFDNGGVPIPVQ